MYQFDRYDQVDGRISELDFAHILLSYAKMNDQRRKKYFKRIKRIYGGELSDCPDAKVHTYVHTMAYVHAWALEILSGGKK